MELNKFVKKLFELSPVNSRQSFYGKCQVIQDENGVFYLRSYDTIVASFSDSDRKVHRHWDGRTMTTSSHINSFLRNVCHGDIDIKDFYNLPLESV